MQMKLIYGNGCPNCNGYIDSQRLELSLPCEKCLEGEFSHLNDLKLEDRIQWVNKQLVDRGKLGAYWYIYDNLRTYQEFKALMNSRGFEPNQLQKYWAKRLLSGENFSIVAPTGIGKTTLLIFYSIYSAKRGNEVLYIVPTRSLMEQIEDKLVKYSDEKIEIKANPKERPGKSSITLVTPQFISRNLQLFNNPFDIIVADDADSIMRSGKITFTVMKGLGVSESLYLRAKELVKLKREIALYKILGKDDSNLKARILEVEGELSKEMMSSKLGQIVVASATGRQKGEKQRILREIFGFSSSDISIYNRNIVDHAIPLNDEEQLLNIIKRMGDGGIVLVSKDMGMKKAEEIRNSLLSHGISAEIAKSGRSFFSKFSNGETDVLVGVSNYYGVIVRGLDEPMRAKYVVFYGVPKTKIALNQALNNPIWILKIMEFVDQERFRKVKSILSKVNYSEINAITIANRKGEKLEGKLWEIQSEMEENAGVIINYVKKMKEVRGSDFEVKCERECFVLIPDVFTYIQGSGRVSRLTTNGVTFGLSLVMYEDENLINMLEKKIKKFSYGFQFNKEEINYDEIKKRIEDSRKVEGERYKLNSCLLIVESPTKAKTIANLFSKPSIRKLGDSIVYESVFALPDRKEIYYVNIIATNGHLCDLSVDEKDLINTHYGVVINEEEIKPIYKFISRCYKCGRAIPTSSDLCPYCGGKMRSSFNLVSVLRGIASQVNEVMIATDPDTEGEKIAYDVYLQLKPFNDNISRIKYHEVTKRAIIEAILNKERVDINKVHAQVVRRIEDRWIGFELSRKLNEYLSESNVGAGRVQTPVLGWVVKRTKEYNSNRRWAVYFKVFSIPLVEFFNEKEEAIEFSKDLEVEVVKGEAEREIIPPFPPFTTSSALEEINRRFRLQPTFAMRILQDLFENGLITYHRTDSTHVSSFGVSIARDYMNRKGLSKYFSPSKWGEEGAHEAIRPTQPLDTEEIKEITRRDGKFQELKWYHFSIYDLIFNRFLASQSKPATVEKRRILLKYKGRERELIVISSIIEDGFTRFYPMQIHEIEEGITEAKVIGVRKSSSVPLFSINDVLRRMKETGIGRPSTYARTIEVLRKHGYLVITNKLNFLVATGKGIKAYDYLANNFPDLVSEEKTRSLLEMMDLIQEGKIKLSEALSIIREEMSSIRAEV